MEDRKMEFIPGRLRFHFSSLIFIFVMGLVLFVSAGTCDWPMAWVLIGVWVVVFIVTISMISPGLMEERYRRHEDVPKWDRVLVSGNILCGFSILIVSGLDFRFSWTGFLPVSVEAIALGLLILSYAFMIWAMRSNTFFSTMVRIQNDRGHVVATGGPYRYLRHPGYAGMIVTALCQPIVLGSLAALVPAMVMTGLFVVRTYLEDRTLQEELEGYKEYAGRVRSRLIPGVW